MSTGGVLAPSCTNRVEENYREVRSGISIVIWVQKTGVTALQIVGGMEQGTRAGLGMIAVTLIMVR